MTYVSTDLNQCFSKARWDSLGIVSDQVVQTKIGPLNERPPNISRESGHFFKEIEDARQNQNPLSLSQQYIRMKNVSLTSSKLKLPCFRCWLSFSHSPHSY